MPWWEWVALIAVFLVFFRIDNQLGLQKGYYVLRHVIRLGVLAALWNATYLRETTGEIWPGFAQFVTAPFRGGTMGMVTLLVGLVGAHFVLRSYWLRKGWDIALKTWRLRPQDYNPEFLYGGRLGLIPSLRGIRERRVDADAKEFDELFDRISKPEP
ncbi:MAG: hypothetical protein WEG36_15320 [Gemmatimonadota bacterium]